jgi:hypothetical protein
VFCCALGFIAGALLTDWLAARASATFARELHARHRVEQQVLAACAMQRGDMAEGVLRYGDAVVAAAPGGSASGRRIPSWPLGFSFAHAALEVLVHPGFGTGLAAMEEAHARAVLGDALERAGRSDEARAEHARAARLLGSLDVEKSRSLGAMQARVFTKLARRDNREQCYLSRTAGTAGVGSSSSIR